MVLLSLPWLIFAEAIREVGSELMDGPGGLGVVATPFRYAVLTGLFSLGVGLFAAVAARFFMRGEAWSVAALRLLMVLGIVIVLVWGIAVFAWLLGQSRLTPDAPPPAASLVIVGFPTLIAISMFGYCLGFLGGPTVRDWFTKE